MMVKRISKKLLEQHGAEFTSDFAANKAVVDKYTTIESQKIRNVVAGYTAKLVKQKGEEGGQKKRNPNSKEDLSKYY